MVSRLITLILLVALVAGLLFTSTDVTGFYMILIVLILVLGSSMWYAPISVSACPDAVVQHSMLKSRVFPMQEIERVALCHPSMGAIRICASGGFMGYWGLFREGDIGRYMAYYGKASDCFALYLKDGRIIMLGCVAPQTMVAYIKDNLSY